MATKRRSINPHNEATYSEGACFYRHWGRRTPQFAEKYKKFIKGGEITPNQRLCRQSWQQQKIKWTGISSDENTGEKIRKAERKVTKSERMEMG